MPKTPRLDTRLESEAAEFLVLGNLLLERILAYKTYTNMPGYDLVATNPERNTSAKIQVKSRWRTNAPGFPIRNFGCDFVVFCRLNRGSKQGAAPVRAPEFYVFPVDVVRGVWNPDDRWGKVRLRWIDGCEQFLSRWDLIRDFLAGGKKPDPPATQAAPDLRPICIDTFRERVRALDSHRLETVKHRGFVVRISEHGLEYTPESSGQSRPHSWQNIELVLDRFNQLRSVDPGDYRDLTRHSSYLMAILRRLFPPDTQVSEN